MSGHESQSARAADDRRAAYKAGYIEGRRRAYRDIADPDALAISLIITDLVAEMRTENPACCGCDWADEAADRAEARLRDVTGDE